MYLTKGKWLVGSEDLIRGSVMVVEYWWIMRGTGSWLLLQMSGWRSCAKQREKGLQGRGKVQSCNESDVAFGAVGAVTVLEISFASHSRTFLSFFPFCSLLTPVHYRTSHLLYFSHTIQGYCPL